ncbi:hypothetical protein [Dysgonomonas macrotermitis]|uniref:Uncharacterized protein n=1 Tax=Dysgonomonas macrotermitis TaxID=1346286 RepID=A0A1M4YJW5_9BACT|nr:hypothetical protein [Dysgonomonas macrotermitis]SHF05686.1 hypothetical protein SAMN05444362_103186 [Dysgonomonas macrotermitis]
MDYKSKIKELRNLLPIPMSEAIQLLKDNDGDIQSCVEIFKKKTIDYISKEAGCNKKTAQKYYEREKFDINRTISMIREDIYDKNYKSIAEVTADRLSKVRSWIAFVEEKDFASALDYNEIQEVIQTLLLIPETKHFGIAIQRARKIKDTIFDKYSDDLSIDEFIRRNVKLDDNDEFRKLFHSVTVSLAILKEEIIRHRRNTK